MRLGRRFLSSRLLDVPGNSAGLVLSQMQNESYTLEAGNKGGKIAAALVKLCQIGAVGEPLLRSGVSQDAFCLFLARVAHERFAKGKTAEQIADAFMLLSGGNASAARQALGGCTLTFEGGKPSSVEAYWLRSGSGRAAPNLSALDD